MKKAQLWWLSIWTLLLTGCTSPDPASIGIIGGADGPTAVVVSGSFAPIGLLLAAVIVVIAVVVLVIRHNKRK